MKMNGRYRFLDHTADIAIMVEGSSLEDLFMAAADAWKVSVSGEVKKVDTDILNAELEGNTSEELLINFLNEINFLLFTKNWLCNKVTKIDLIEEPGNCRLTAQLSGFKINNSDELKQEIKSVTYHQVDIKQEDGIFSTIVVFDI